MVLEGNIGVLSALRSFYHELGENHQFPLRNNCVGDLSLFTRQIDSFIYDSKMHIARGQLIAKIIAARKTVVRIFALLFFKYNVRSQCKLMIILDPSAFAKPSNREDGATDEKYAKRFSNGSNHSFLDFPISSSYFCFGTYSLLLLLFDGLKRRQTFFSTDIVKYQNQNLVSTSDASGPTKQYVSFSPIALNRWLQVTLPLTFLTFVAAILWLWREDRKLRRVYQELPFVEPKSG